MDSFDDETRTLINAIHHAWKSQASLSEYALLRDRIIAQRDRLDVQITALSTVVRLVVRRSPACEEQGDLSWQDFFALAATLPPEGDGDGDDVVSPKASRRRPQNWNDICRSRNLAIIVALWSAEIVQYYKWDRVGQGQMRIIRICAVQFPDFEAAFVPRLNQVLLTRHCVAILHCRERTLNEARIQPLKDFEVDAIRSATIDWDLQYMWLTNQDGAIPLDSNGTLLKDIRPQHYRMYLLQKDQYGTLEPRRFPDSCPANANPVGPPVAAMETFMPEGLMDVVQSSPAQIIAPSCIPSTPSVAVASPKRLDSSIIPADPTLADFYHLGCATLADPSCVPQIFQNAFGNADPTLLPNPGTSPSESGAPWTPQTAFPFGGVSPPSVAFQGSWDDSDSFWAHASTQFASLQCSPEAAVCAFQLEEIRTAVDVCAADGSSKNLPCGYPRARKRPRHAALGDSVPVNGDSDGREDVIDAHADGARARYLTRGLAKSLSPPTNITPGLMNRSLDLRLSSDPLESADELTIEGRLHNKHLSNLTNYIKKQAGMMDRDQRWTQTQWLTEETRWAMIWSSNETLGSGRASCEDEADVLYCTAADIVAHAKAGKTVRKPIVVKEGFTDSGMHTIAQFLALLQDFSPHPDLDILPPGNKEPASTRENECAPIARSTSDTSSGLIASHLRNMTKSHRPIFTMLPRFRLLETLTEGHQWDEQERMEPSPFGLRACTGSNTVSLPGAFSGAHAYAFYGTWTRNLEGTSYFMIVPEVEMASEWEAFASEGDKWIPRGRERLIVLEEDDVLLIPPGSRIVHAVHFPSDCLTEGGMLWDSLNVLETLRSILWACENHFTAHNPLPTDLSVIIHRLQQLVFAQPEKFRGTLDSASFLGMFESAIEALQETLRRRATAVYR